jgi:C-terminal processing protease CtpA/Prc
VRLDRSAHPPGDFSFVGGSIPIDFTGKGIELHGFLRTKEVTGFAGLWLREDGESGVLEFDNMARKQIAGTRDWQEFSITLPLDAAAQQLYFGALLSGNGVAWADDLQLLVDGVPVARAAERPQSPEGDREFDHGSGIQLTQLTSLQIENLTTLARVWGFLKYHDPVVTAGNRRWDYDLFRVMPGVLAAHSRAESNALLVKWIDSLGPLDACNPCASLGLTELKLKPDIAWIGDTEYLGVPLSHWLSSIYQNRVPYRQHYLSLTSNGNPAFDHESTYTALVFPDSGYQLLGLFRLWNIVEYWAPYRDVVGENWPVVLGDFIPRIALARDKDSYTREMMAMIARIHDTHANLWGSFYVRPPVGKCMLPINLRFIDQSAVVAAYTSDAAGKASGLQPGDEITALDGVAVNKLVAEWAPLYADSNEAARFRDMARNLTDGPCGSANIGVRRNNTSLSVSATRLDPSEAGTPTLTHDLPGATFRLLSSDVAYLKLSSVKGADLPRYIESAKQTRGLIVDIRNYPSEFVVFSLGSLLVHRPTSFAFFTSPDRSNPGAFHPNPPVSLTPSEPHYDGKVVILVDEVTQSQAEYTTMALRSSPNAIVLGSTTAGADGDVSRIPLPGGLNTMISGLGIFYPDGSPTQRVGIHVDVEVRPTIPGIRAGRDEVLEAAIHQIAPELPDSEVEKVARSDREVSRSSQ